MEKEGWKEIYRSGDRFDVKVMEARLKEQGIESVVFNHQDSMYKSLNDTNYGVALYVKNEDVEKAKKIIAER